jgi:hypothetical protein
MIQYSEAYRFNLEGRGVLDTPLARGMTSYCGAATSPHAPNPKLAVPLPPNTSPRARPKGSRKPPSGMFVACFLGSKQEQAVHDQNYPPS